MGIMQRRKGANAEREIVNILKDAGIPAKRISMMETGGIDKGDVELMDIYKGQVKRGQIVPAWIYKARDNGEEFLFVKRDREKWLVVLDLEFFLKNFI